MYSCGPPHMDVQEWDDQHELTYSSYVRTRVVTLKTCRRRWMIGRNGERRSGISAQAARHDDDDEMVEFLLKKTEKMYLICFQKLLKLKRMTNEGLIFFKIVDSIFNMSLIKSPLEILFWRSGKLLLLLLLLLCLFFFYAVNEGMDCYR